MKSISKLLFVVLLAASAFNAAAQIVTLGRTPYDKFLPGFWNQNTNADRLIEGINLYSTLKFNSVSNADFSTNFVGQLSPTNFNYGLSASSNTLLLGDGTWGSLQYTSHATNSDYAETSTNSLFARQIGTYNASVIPIIFEEDMDSDCDDAGHLALAHALMSANVIKIIATGTCSTNTNSANVIAALNYFYGRPTIPVGYAPFSLRGSATSAYDEYITTNWLPRYNYQPSLLSAVSVYRQALADAEAGTVKIVTAGQLGGLSNLLVSAADEISTMTGYELMTNKVLEIISVASFYPGDPVLAEYNISTDGNTALWLCNAITNIPWTFIPCNAANTNAQVAYAPFVGSELQYGHPEDSPLRIIFDIVLDELSSSGYSWSTGRQGWGQMGTLYAAFGTNAGFNLIEGTNVIGGGGINTFTPGEGGPHKMAVINSGSATNNIRRMIASLESGPGYISSGSGLPGSASPEGTTDYSTYGNVNSELHAYINNSNTGTNASSVLGLIAGSTISQTATLSENYLDPDNYGTNAGSFQIINRNGPIIFKADDSGYGFRDSNTVMTLTTSQTVGLNGYLSSVAGLSASSVTIGDNTSNPGAGGLYVHGEVFANDHIRLYGLTDSAVSFQRGSTNHGALGLESGGSLATGSETNEMVLRYMTGNLNFASAAGAIKATLAQAGNLSVAGALVSSNGISMVNVMAMPTNYVADNFVPTPGYGKVAWSNNVLYAITETKTNVVVNNEP